MNVELQEGY